MSDESDGFETGSQEENGDEGRDEQGWIPYGKWCAESQGEQEKDQRRSKYKKKPVDQKKKSSNYLPRNATSPVPAISKYSMFRHGSASSRPMPTGASREKT